MGTINVQGRQWSRHGDETKMNRRVAISLLTRSLAVGLAFRRCTVAAASSTRYQELKRYAVPEARQAVAVDSDCFYAIGNSSVAKYSKESGARVPAGNALKVNRSAT